jgi:S-adenosylmethionine:tRNA ribosyltransferase-isomerase
MKTRDFYFDLPPGLVAQYPPAVRGESRLMTVNRGTGKIAHHAMRDLPALLPPRCVCVFNNSRVRKARLYAVNSETGGRAEFLLLSSRNAREWAFLCDKSRRLRPGAVFVFPEDLRACIGETRDGEFVLNFERPLEDAYLERRGAMPLPPYIRRAAAASDSERYQTIYADPPGSAAAPTAGLHFTSRLFEEMDARSLERVMVTLHVGLGTFLPVRADIVENHTMHEEEYFIGEAAAAAVNRGKSGGKRLLAVGTTSLRVLETAWNAKTEKLPAGSGATRIFIYPGYTFQAVDTLFTNFHTPESTLLMLVSAFAGKDLIFKAYEEAKKEKYRFFSYGDAMLIL